eukprot:gene16581-22814_t
MALALLEIQPELKKLPRKLRSFCLAHDISSQSRIISVKKSATLCSVPPWALGVGAESTSFEYVLRTVRATSKHGKRPWFDYVRLLGVEGGTEVSWYAELRLLFVLRGVDCAFVRWLEVCVPPQDDVLSVYGCTYLKDVDDGADDKGYYVVKLESIKAFTSIPRLDSGTKKTVETAAAIAASL